MGVVPLPKSSPALRLLLRLVSVLAALVVLSVTERAAAMVAVGMCGERGETVEAPPIFRAVNDDGTISPLPCRSPTDAFSNPSAPLAPERVVVWERPERVLGFGNLFVAQAESARVPVSAASRARLRPGFVVALFRPPRG